MRLSFNRLLQLAKNFFLSFWIAFHFNFRHVKKESLFPRTNKAHLYTKNIFAHTHHFETKQKYLTSF